jgi:hypothetical protein
VWVTLKYLTHYRIFGLGHWSLLHEFLKGRAFMEFHNEIGIPQAALTNMAIWSLPSAEKAIHGGVWDHRPRR